MLSDATDILAAAGVSVPEVDEYMKTTTGLREPRQFDGRLGGNRIIVEQADAAILALAEKLREKTEEAKRLDGEVIIACRSVQRWQERAGTTPFPVRDIRAAVSCEYAEEASDD